MQPLQPLRLPPSRSADLQRHAYPCLLNHVCLALKI